MTRPLCWKRCPFGIDLHACRYWLLLDLVSVGIVSDCSANSEFNSNGRRKIHFEHCRYTQLMRQHLYAPIRGTVRSARSCIHGHVHGSMQSTLSDSVSTRIDSCFMHFQNCSAASSTAYAWRSFNRKRAVDSVTSSTGAAATVSSKPAISQANPRKNDFIPRFAKISTLVRVWSKRFHASAEYRKLICLTKLRAECENSFHTRPMTMSVPTRATSG